MERTMFKAVNPRIDIQKVEQEALDFWRMNHIFQRTMKEREDGPRYVFYEGPPTANGTPGSHHVLARAFKDVFPRYKTMQGYYCLRRGGWDTHGLPVEIAVEKELGLNHKHEIDAYGVAEFNKKCRDSVFRNITDWEKLTERIAYWVDLDTAYVTFTNEYVESVWWILKQLWEKDLLYQGYKIVPYCTRCGTPLSSHEVSLGYKDIKDPSVFVRFPLKGKQGVYFLVWTTTPWTLPGNVALAVGKDVDYVQVEGPTPDGEGTEQLILAEALVEKALNNPEDYKVVKKMKGKDLVGMHYNPLYTFLPVDQDYAYVLSGDFVSTEDGTGIVHIAPAFGQDDMDVGHEYDLPILRTVGASGKFIDAVTKFRGQWFKEADPDITRDLVERGLMYKVERYEHSYPYCWRCDTPLMYFARETWFVATTKLKDQMIANNNTVKWVPGHIQSGRFGNWLDTLKDWALGRERYWGTPLPIWIDDENGDSVCVGSVAELEQLTGRELTDLDLHRPYVDEITFPNPRGTGGTMRRIPELIDVWFDSGAMPFAQWGYPHRNVEQWENQFPADFICEAIDQTRGWFYSLHAIGTMVADSVAFKNVICLGHILDENGKKMSKSLGNIVDPWAVLDAHGADAFRWYMYTAGPPGESRRFSVNLVGEVVKKFWSTLWNTYSFFVTYANLDGWTPTQDVLPVEERALLDRWVLAELHQLTKTVTHAMENYDVTNATRPVQAFVESLSNWYVRLSRRRFWKGDGDADKLSAYATLYECLVTVSKLLAPTMPFLSESVYRNLVAGVDKDAPDSVHLNQWPEFDEKIIDEKLVNEMRVVQRLVRLGLSARNSMNMGVRQPLAEAMFAVREAAEADIVERYADLIKTELNVKKATAMEGPGEIIKVVLNPLPALLGKKFGKNFPKVQKALRGGEQADVRKWAEAFTAGESVVLELDGATYTVTPEECEVKREAAEGYAVAEEKGYLAALDTTLTEELQREGLAREVVRRVQSMRKDADYEISDHIDIVYTADEKLVQAIEQFNDYVKSETLAESLKQGEPGDDHYRAEYAPHEDSKQDTSIKGERLVVGIKRIEK
jgi:isoleucyl-tRNA synthetase